MTPALLEQLLSRAKNEELGLAIETNNPVYLHQQLMNSNKDRDLIIARPSTPGVVFIVKRGVELY